VYVSPSSSSWAVQPRVGLGLLKKTPPSGTVKDDIFPVSNTDVVEIFFKPINQSVYACQNKIFDIRLNFSNKCFSKDALLQIKHLKIIE
jgi:hypothetical protein